MILHDKLARVETVSRSDSGEAVIVTYRVEGEDGGAHETVQQLFGFAAGGAPKRGALVTISVDEQWQVVGPPRLRVQPPDAP